MLSFVESNKKAKKEPLLSVDEEDSTNTAIPLAVNGSTTQSQLSDYDSNEYNDSVEKDLDTVMHTVDTICINLVMLLIIPSDQ